MTKVQWAVALYLVTASITSLLLGEVTASAGFSIAAVTVPLWPLREEREYVQEQAELDAFMDSMPNTYGPHDETSMERNDVHMWEPPELTDVDPDQAQEWMDD